MPKNMLHQSFYKVRYKHPVYGNLLKILQSPMAKQYLPHLMTVSIGFMALRLLQEI